MLSIIILLEFLALIIVLSLIMFYGVRYIGRLVGSRVNDIHKEAEYILNCERVPASWVREPPGNAAQQSTKQIRRRKKEKRRYLRRLKKLQRYFSNAPVFEDITSRQQALFELERIEEYWQQADWDEITSPADLTPDMSQDKN